jgi:prefoldin subunit 5
MAKKVKNPELLVAEIHSQQSKLKSLEAQLRANQAKLERLQSTNDQIRKKGNNLSATLQRNIARAQAAGIRI